MRVKDIMTEDPIVVKLPGTRTEILRIMVTKKLTGVPIVKKDGTYVGFVARKHIFASPTEEQLALLVQKDWPTTVKTGNVEDVARLFVEGDIHHMPVVSKKKVVGMLTPADFLEAVQKKNVDTPVSELTRSPCVPVYEKTPLKVALEIIKVAKVFALPVLDKTGKLSGIITDRDIFNQSHINGSIAISDLGLGEDEDSWSWDGLRNVMKLYYEESKIDLPKIDVVEVMVKKPVTVFEKTGAAEAARMMMMEDFGQLPVIDMNDRLVAMLYELDVVATLVQ
ncbi:MAG: CBS domain-containing protein [Candidatus Thermoplasmatota archaeon]|nr:CBS domain-containing protein [Candidatus Thermoplasmatota archaeon]